MIRFSSTYPFVLEVPMHNPWDGSRAVDVWVEALSPLGEVEADVLQSYVFPFWLLGSGGALCGDAVPPGGSTCAQPAFSSSGLTARFTYAPSLLDERATVCLANLLWGAHATVPLGRVIIDAHGISRVAAIADATVDDPYPPLPSNLPFPVTIEDSESDIRVLRVTWASALDEVQRALVKNELLAFGAAASVGAFAAAPERPSQCGCVPHATVTWDESALEWALERCRFHGAALHALVSTCAALSVRVAPIIDVEIE